MKTQPFNPVDFFESQEEIADYLTEAYHDDDPRAFIAALGHVVRHRGISETALDTGLNRESLYKALSGKVNPKWDTIHKLLKVLDVKIKIAA